MRQKEDTTAFQDERTSDDGPTTIERETMAQRRVTASDDGLTSDNKIDLAFSSSLQRASKNGATTIDKSTGPSDRPTAPTQMASDE